MAGGRPTKYNAELATKICELLATNTCGLDKICEANDDLPSQSTIRKWRFDHPEFSAKYLQAKQFQVELYAEETIEIASYKPYYTDDKGIEKIDAGHVAWQKLNVNTRQWHASKLAPKIYGDKKHSEENNSPQETLSKIQELVNDLNKTNTSEI